MVKKKKESRALPQKQKSRAKYPFPPELEEMLRQVNLIPLDFQMISFERAYDEQRQLLREQTGDNNAAPSTLEVLNACLEDTPVEFQRHIEHETLQRTNPFGFAKPHMVDVYNIQTKANVYGEYFAMRTSIWRLVQRLETERQRMREAETEHQLERGSLTFEHYTLLDWDAFPLSISTVLKRDDAGKLHITGLAALIGEFDDSRLRRCVICQRIYWAKRENSKTCSPLCLNRLNVRRHRNLTDEEKAEKKAQREANKNLKVKPKNIRKIK